MRKSFFLSCQPLPANLPKMEFHQKYFPMHSAEFSGELFNRITVNKAVEKVEQIFQRSNFSSMPYNKSHVTSKKSTMFLCKLSYVITPHL